ncbi:alcohol dehydrogenase catalytic domain-containing protein [Frankia sp. AgB32]|uniref:alcohol dehydrogenase catalytic domain-containing protein n=1 Tax=Frankia sp. AgB32 TaxID=631119 RepID=UPI00200CAC46|nr:alcohol dehydrogenase catalytic domain-containing protein [Frankia sp. AgB32]MCK9896262.1 alcohol dehydrogenase catalytic domain-containing protein [Frankia sp. AgB32]
MRQLVLDVPGSYSWHDAADPELTAPEQAIVRPVAVACCDLDVAVAQSRAPLPPGYAQGHEGVAEVVAVGGAVTTLRPGDRVVVPFQLNCGHCRECRRGVTGSCSTVPPWAMYGLGSIAGLDAGGFLADLVSVRTPTPC